MKRSSIARRLVTFVLLVEFCSALAITCFTYIYERHEHVEVFDVSLHGYADQLLGAVQDDDDAKDSVTLDTRELHFPSEDLYEVREKNGAVLGSSHGWTPPPDFLSAERSSQTMNIGGTDYRMVRVSGVRVVDPGTSNVRHELTVVYASPAMTALRPVIMAVESFACASFVLMLTSGLSVAWMVRRSMRPLALLAHEAGAISTRSWSFTPDVRTRNTRELAPLAQALEDLVARLQHSFAQQRRFVSDSAHELKTGVTVVKSSLQLLALRERSPQEYRAGLETCLTDCARMEELVYRMLTLARVEEGAGAREGRLEAESSKGLPPLTELRRGALDAVASLASLAQLRQVSLACAVDKELTASMPAEDWQTLLNNLLMNAIQHTPPQGSIHLEITARRGEAWCSVSDTGTGIPPETLPHVFERFFRGDASRVRRTGEAGLGLAIAKAVVERAGGSISISSTRGVGTRVEFTLPLLPPVSEHVSIGHSAGVHAG